MQQMVGGETPEFSPITLFFDEREPQLGTKELSAYLYYFRCVYAIAHELSKSMTLEFILENRQEYLLRFQAYVANTPSHLLLNKLHSTDLGPLEPMIVKMKKESPLEIVITGSIVALVAAAIISGGEVDLKVATFKLKPIGDGLKKLRDLFRD